MATYKVTDPTTGKTVSLTGDSPPNEQELEEVFSSLGSQPSQSTEQPQGLSLEGLRPEGTNPATMGLSAAAQTLGLQPAASGLEAAGNLAMGPARLSQTFGEGSEALGGQVTEALGRHGVNPYISATAGLATEALSDPRTYIPMGKLGYSSKLEPFSGKPGMAAQIKKMRTGVEASAFEQLRRDPTAFFSRRGRAEAGQAVGDAKQAAGINVGVTDDIKSLTPENISHARNIQGTANKAQDAIIEKVELTSLPVVKEGSKTGQPHAVFAYKDNFGPGGTERSIYNVFGDPQHPSIKQRGWGSSVAKEDLDAMGIPVTGRKAGSEKYVTVEPNEVSQALEGVNKRLSKLERSEGRGSPSFQQWSQIKSHFQDMLENVAPNVKAANKDFSRVALRDKFMEPFPVNQSGTMSKISAFGGAPLAGGVGAVMGGGPGALAAAALYQGARSPFVAGLGTAARGLIDKMVDPALSGTANQIAARGGLIGMFTDNDRRDRITRFIENRSQGSR